MKLGALSLWTAASLSFGFAPAHAEPVKTRLVEVELVSEMQAIRPGEPFWIGLRLEMKPEWHTYWQNPGDSGLATELTWQLPDGFRADALVWPYPQRFEHEPYVSYGYEGETFLLARLEPPADLEAGSTVLLPARADWTVCREDLCTPGGADLELELRVTADATTPDNFWKQHFETTRARVPATRDDWSARATAQGNSITLTLSSDNGHDPGNVLLFERAQNTIDHSQPVVVERDGNTVRIRAATVKPAEKLPARFEAALVAEHGWSTDGGFKALAVSTPLQR